jgi:hypothetical protein
MTDKETPLSGQWETVEINRKDEPDVRFEGKLLAEVNTRDDTRQKGREKTRWRTLELYELRSGKWVATNVACSDVADEIDFGTTLTLDQADLDERRRAVMGFWGNSWLAKSAAAELGWDVTETIE